MTNAAVFADTRAESIHAAALRLQPDLPARGGDWFRAASRVANMHVPVPQADIMQSCHFGCTDDRGMIEGVQGNSKTLKQVIRA